MFSDTSGWLLLLVDVSLKTTLLAMLAAAGLALFRVTNLDVRHRVWTAVLLGMLAMPLVVNAVPGLSIPVPGLAWISSMTTPTAVEPAKMPSESNTRAISGEPIINQGLITPGMDAPITQATKQPISSPASEMSLPSLENQESKTEASADVQSEFADNQAGAVPWRVIVSTFITGLVATYAGIALILITRLFLGILRATFLIRASTPITESSSLAPARISHVGCRPGREVRGASSQTKLCVNRTTACESTGFTTEDAPTNEFARQHPTDRVRESKLIRVPITVGMLRPCVLLPVGWRDWSQDKLDVVLRHELTHIARGDYAVNLIAEFNRCLYWFHPLAWCLIHWLSELAERNCDDAVIASTGNRTSYARHLLEIAATVVEPTRAAIQPGISMARSADVESRIDAILDMDRPLSKRMGWKSTALLLAAMLPTFWLAAALRAEKPNESDVESQIETENKNEPAKEEAPSSVSKVSGRAVDDQGLPVANASISLVLYSHEPDRDLKPTPPAIVWGTAQSDAEGGFSLKYPAVNDPEYYTKRAYRLVAIAQKEGLGLGWKYIEFSDKETATEITLPPGTVRRGRLVGLEGQPIAGAMVHVVGVGTPAPKWLEYRKWPFHDGLPVDELVDTTIPVYENDHLWPNLIRFRLPPFAVQSWPKSVISDDNGVFEIRGVTAQHLVEFHIYGTDQGGSVEHSLSAGDGLAEPVTFALDAPRTITGVVTDKLTGEPIAGAKVRVDSAGAIMVMARMPVVADWKGRQGHLGNLFAIQGNRTVFLMPAAFTTTDNEGRYRISAFRNQGGFQNDFPFAITVSSPVDASYLPSKKTIPWPRKTAFKQEADLQLTPGVRVTARIISADGRPAPRARIDYWSRELLYPYEQIESSNGIPRLSPDGVQHPHWRKADGEGRVEMIVPRGESYLFVNQESHETVVDRVDATQVGLPDQEVLIPSPIGSILPPRTSVEPHRFYPDRAVSLSYAADKVSDELTIQLHQKAPKLTVEVVLPDGTPANDLIYMGGQAPFRYYALRDKRLMQKIGDNKFSIACCDTHDPVSVAFLARGSGLGLHTEFAVQDIRDKVVTLTLQPLGQARARFIDKDPKKKPLTAFRPLMWMSLPRKPFSTAADLEQQTVSPDSRFLPLQQSFDSIWTVLLHEHAHGSLKTDAEGNALFKALIPGATYRISQFGGQTRDFAVQPGETIDLGDVVVFEPERTKSLPQSEPQASEEANAPAEQQAGEAVLAKKNEPMSISGRVLGADGKPVAGAKIHIVRTFPGLTPEPDRNPRPVATSDESGAFQFAGGDQLDRSSLQIIVTAEGHGPEWLPLADAIERGTMDISLSKDAPINGRILTLEGQPVIGATISVASIRAMRNGDLTSYIETVKAGNGSNFRFDQYLFRPFDTASVTTDAEGRFRLSGVGQNRVVELEIVGRAIQHATLRVMTLDSAPIRARAGRRFAEMGTPPVFGASFEWLARPSRPIVGKVVDAKTGEPLKGVQVGALDEAHATTDQNGRFELIGCAKAKNYRLLVSSQDQPYVLGSKYVSDTPGLEPLEIRLEMTRGIVVTGRVTDPRTNNPVAARIVYYPLHPNTNVVSGIGGSEARAMGAFCERQTNKDGEFSIAVLPGPGFIGVTAEDHDKYQSAKVDPLAFFKRENVPYATNTKGMERSLIIADSNGGKSFMPQSNFQAIELLNLPIGKDDPIRREIQLRAAHKVTGVVLDADGKPVEGTTAYGLAEEYLFSSKLVSGSEFVVTALGDDENRPLLFRHETRRLVGIADVTANTPQPIQVTLQPWGEVSGRLIDKDGQPLANLEIGTVGRENELKVLGALPRRRATDDQGRFHIEALVPGLTYDIRPSERPEPKLRIVLKSGEILDVGDVSGVYDSATRPALNPKESKTK